MITLPLSELLGTKVLDATGTATGTVREVTLAPQENRDRIASFIVKTKSGNRILPFGSVSAIDASIHASSNPADWPAANGNEGLFLLERDLLDQQVIDINGRKVVRVNDVDLTVDAPKAAGPNEPTRAVLRVVSVDVGARGAVRRLLRGVAPRAALHALLGRIPPRTIPWNFVDLIETDPARRVKLKISHDGLAKLHPADIADIVEEMRPDLAADLLGDLSEDRTEQILVQMEPEERQDVVELLEHGEETAAGRMTTEFLALPVTATVQNAVDSMRHFEGGVEAVSTIYLVDSHGTLVGAVPLAKIVLAEPATPMLSLTQEPLILSHEGVGENEVAELFDKYNLLMMPVVDEHNKLTGVITSDDVISMLRAKL